MVHYHTQIVQFNGIIVIDGTRSGSTCRLDTTAHSERATVSAFVTATALSSVTIKFHCARYSTITMERYVTSQLAAKTADGMLTPLIDSDDDDSDEDSDFDSSASVKVETVKRTPMQVLKSLVGKHIMTWRV